MANNRSKEEWQTLNMDGLENEFGKLNVNQSNQSEVGSITPETSNNNTADESLSPLDLFIRDLDERKGKLPCCQEVTDIQTSVENVLKALLLAVEEELPFYKTTLINSGSFYEGTKVGKPNEFDYFVQLDNFSRPEDIRFEELPHSMVIVIPSESAIEKLRKDRKVNPYYCDGFDWKKEVKTPFVETLNSKLSQGFEAFGLKTLHVEKDMDRHGPAYTLELEWNGGELYKGLKITVDLSLAVKINYHSSTMAVEFESPSGKVIRSLLDTYYFAVSTYREVGLEVPPSKLFKEFQEAENQRDTFRNFEFLPQKLRVSIKSPSDFRLRCSQSCLERSLFCHFGPHSGPSVCLRVLKVLRHMTLLPDEMHFKLIFPLHGIKNFVDTFGTLTKLGTGFGMWTGCITEHNRASTKWISSYALKTLVLFEWSKNPEDQQWAGNNLSQRLLNIVENLLRCLKHGGMRSFFYKDYNVLPSKDKDSFLPEAINRMTIIRKWTLSIKNCSKYSYEDCLQNIRNEVMLTCRKQGLTRFLYSSLEHIFDDKIKDILAESCGRSIKEEKMLSTTDTNNNNYFPWSMRHFVGGLEYVLEPSVFIDIYIQALLKEIAPEEELIITSNCKPGEEKIIGAEEDKVIVKQARNLFKEIACNRMKGLDNLPNYSLWSRDFKSEEVEKLLQFLCDNLEKDIEILRNKIKTQKETMKIGDVVVT